MWVWHPENDQVEVSPKFLALMKFEEWMGYVDPADRLLVADEFDNVRANPETSIIMEARFCNIKGSCHWFNVHADWYRETEDKPFV